ncbi:MAG: invasin domain 3-containing protein [Balneolaceae bacterium]
MERLFKISSALVFFLFVLTMQVNAQTVTPATGGTGISADNFATGTWTTLSGPSIQETSPGQLQAGNIRFQVPSGFIFDTGGTDPTITVTQSKGNRITVTLTSRTSSELIFDLTGNSGGSPPNNPHLIEFGNIRIRPAQGSPLASGEIRNAGSAAPGGTQNYGTLSMIAGADNKIRVENAATSGGSVVSTQDVEAGSSITVYSNVRDQFNNFKRNETATWSLQNITGGVVSGDLSPSAASATFTGNLVGSANIQATSGGLSVVQSDVISVVPSDATTLAISTQPSATATAGVQFATQPVVQIQDDYTNVITSDDFTQISAARNSGSGTLQGTKTVTVNDGVATFTNLNHTIANTIDLSFSASGFSNVVSNSIDVSPAAADSLVFTVQPTNANRNTNMSPAVEVQIVDEFGNFVAQSGTEVTLSISFDSNSPTSISGNVENTDANGLATYSSLSFNKIGQKRIEASATGLNTSEESNNFTIADAGSLAGFEVEISGTGTIGTQTAGTPFDIRIEAVDGIGDLLDGNMGRDNFSGNVDLTTTSEFSGTTTITSVGPFVNGVYDPHNVELILSGSNISITATNSSGSEAGSSNLFTVNPGAANIDSSFISVSEDTLIADGTSESEITVQLRDEFGNDLITGGDNVVISRTGTGTLSSVTDNSDGTYTATLTASNDVGSATISAEVNSSAITSGDPEVVYTFGTLSTFLIEAAAGGNIGTQTAGTSFNIQITAQDAYNNTVTTFNGTGNTTQITSTATLSSGGGTTAEFTNGILSSHAVTITSAGSTTITARKTASTESGVSNSFTVNPGAADETVSTITSSQSFLQNNGTDQATITVQLKDQFGNNLISGGNTVVLSVTGASTLSAVTDNANGTYTSTLTAGTTSETATITGTVDGQNITDNATVTITQFNVWQGDGGGNPAGRSDWGTAGNWSLGSIPTTGQVVLIESGWTYYPIISDQDPVIDFLSIEAGGTVTLSSRIITINNEISGGGSFSGNNGTINLNGDSKISNFISGSSTVNMSGTSTQFVEGDFTANILNIQNDVSSSGYLEAFSQINVETGNTLTMTSGSDLVALGDFTVNGSVVGNSSNFQFGGDITGSNFTLNNTSVTLNGTTLQEINGIEEIKSFTIDNTAGAIVNNDLTVTDTLFINNGFLTIASGYSFVSNVKEGSTANIRMQREISGNRGWRLIAPPLASTYSDFLDNTITQGYPNSDLGNAPVDSLQPNVLWYDETYAGTDNQRWRAPTDANNNLTPGRGLFVYFFDDVAADTRYNEALPDTLEIEGEENNGNGTEFTFPVTFTSSADTGWNLVGNPFAATIDWDDGNWTKTNMDNVLYVWDPATNDYLDWNGVSGSLGDGKIMPFQAFWVKANGNGAPALKVNKSSKTTSGTFYGKDRKVPAAIGFTLTAENLNKSMHITLTPDGSNGKDIRDAYRLLPFDTDTYLELYSSLENGTELAINNLARSFGKEISIPIYVGGFMDGAPLNGDYQLSWPEFGDIPESWVLILEDRDNGKEINLRNVTSYSFSLFQNKDKQAITNTIQNFTIRNTPNKAKTKTQQNNARFILRIDPGEDADGLPDKFELFNNYPNPFNPATRIRFAVPIEGPVELSVYDILGRKVATLVNQNYHAGFHEVSWDAYRFSSGTYIYRLKTKNGVFTKKMSLIK